MTRRGGYDDGMGYLVFIAAIVTTASRISVGHIKLKSSSSQC